MIRMTQSISTACRKLQFAALLRSYSTSTPLTASLPYHLVVGLPALSPTMDSGSLAEWYVKEGDKFSAGDAVAKIETDKASIDFEAQDDGYVAKILQPVGVDFAVGTPIMVTVEDEQDVAAFANYVLPEESAPAVVVTPEPVKVEAPPTPRVEPPAPPKVEAPLPPRPSLMAPPPPPPPQPVTAPVASTTAVTYGFSTAKVSPLAKTLAAQQKAYVERYGTTGQRPIL